MGTHENESSGVSRRDLLKKGAVAGGIVWTAPLVLSARDVAGASHGGSGPECNRYFRAKWELSNGGTWSDCLTGVGTQDCLGETTRTYESACDYVSPADGPPQPYSEGGYVLYVPETLPDGSVVQQVSGATKGGSDNQPGSLPSCGINDGELLTLQQSDALGFDTRVWRVVFDGQAPNGAGLSHAEIIFCVYTPMP